LLQGFAEEYEFRKTCIFVAGSLNYQRIVDGGYVHICGAVDVLKMAEMGLRGDLLNG
jgi:hypothetical protein